MAIKYAMTKYGPNGMSTSFFLVILFRYSIPKLIILAIKMIINTL